MRQAGEQYALPRSHDGQIAKSRALRSAVGSRSTESASSCVALPMPTTLHFEIRRLYYGEHWKVGTNAAAVGVHHEDAAKVATTMNQLSRFITCKLFPHDR